MYPTLSLLQNIHIKRALKTSKCLLMIQQWIPSSNRNPPLARESELYDETFAIQISVVSFSFPFRVSRKWIGDVTIRLLM